MKRFALFAALLLCVSGPVFAKPKVSVTVSVNAKEDEFKSRLEQALQAKINSTERYTIVNAERPADILLHVRCLVLQSHDGNKPDAVCYSHVTFYPFGDSDLWMDLGEAMTMVASSMTNTGYFVQGLIDIFINGTTNEGLENSRLMMRSLVHTHCTNNPNDCTKRQ